MIRLMVKLGWRFSKTAKNPCEKGSDLEHDVHQEGENHQYGFHQAANLLSIYVAFYTSSGGEKWGQWLKELELIDRICDVQPLAACNHSKPKIELGPISKSKNHIIFWVEGASQKNVRAEEFSKQKLQGLVHFSLL